MELKAYRNGNLSIKAYTIRVTSQKNNIRINDKQKEPRPDPKNNHHKDCHHRQ
jgi:hypothetical protein